MLARLPADWAGPAAQPYPAEHTCTHKHQTSLLPLYACVQLRVLTTNVRTAQLLVLLKHPPSTTLSAHPARAQWWSSTYRRTRRPPPSCSTAVCASRWCPWRCVQVGVCGGVHALPLCGQWAHGGCCVWFQCVCAGVVACDVDTADTLVPLGLHSALGPHGTHLPHGSTCISDTIKMHGLSSGIGHQPGNSQQHIKSQEVLAHPGPTLYLRPAWRRSPTQCL